MNDDQPVYDLEAQGLWGEQPPQTSVEDMAACYIRGIREVQPEGPHMILAFSAGGAVGWEMAQQLRSDGDTPFLGFLDAPAPTGPRRRRQEGQPARVRPQRSIRARMFFQVRHGVFHLRNLASLSVKGRRTYMRELLHGQIGWQRAGWLSRKLGRPQKQSQEQSQKQGQRKGGMRVGRERPAGHFTVRRAISNAWSEYAVQPYAGPVTQFRARLQRPMYTPEDRNRGWEKSASAGVEIVDVPGHHEYIFVDPHIKKLAKAITAWAARAQASR